VRHLSWLITAPLTLLAIVFAVSNRGDVPISFWPLPFLVNIPAFALVLGSLVAGFLAGGLFAWAGGRRQRRAARAEKIRAAALEKELETLRASLPAAGAVSPPMTVDARVSKPLMSLAPGGR